MIVTVVVIVRIKTISTATIPPMITTVLSESLTDEGSDIEVSLRSSTSSVHPINMQLIETNIIIVLSFN